MEAIEELVQLSDSMRQAAAVLADEDVDNYKRPSTFLNVVALGNVVSFSSLYNINQSIMAHDTLFLFTYVMCCVGLDPLQLRWWTGSGCWKICFLE